jgi:hypothetical protein
VSAIFGNTVDYSPTIKTRNFVKKVIAFFGCMLSLFASHAALAEPIAPPCLSGICIGQPFSEIANRNWLTDTGGYWTPAPTDRVKQLPINEPIRTALNAPHVASLYSSYAAIHSRKGIELMQQAKFCAGYWFYLETLDEHGWVTTVQVIPVMDPDGQVTLRVYSLQKELKQPLITQAQSEQRSRNFHDQFAVYMDNVTPYSTYIGAGTTAIVHLSYKKDLAMMLDDQTQMLRRQPGCEQASAGF